MWAGAAETYARQEGERASNAIWRWPGERESAAEFSSTFISEIKCLTARCTKISSSLYNQDECDHGCMARKTAVGTRYWLAGSTTNKFSSAYYLGQF